MKTVEDLLTEEIKDLYSAEKQLTKAIPKMAKGASDASLKQALEAHLEETKNQVNRLEEAATILGIKPSGKKCVGMEGVVSEGDEILQEDGEEQTLDLAIIGAASRVEHYEISGYLTAISLAEQLGHQDVVKLLQASLREEENAEKSLRKLAGQLLPEAAAAA